MRKLRGCFEVHHVPLHITDIRIVEGFGAQDAAFIVGVRAVSRPLDLAEAPREQTHTAGGSLDKAQAGARETEQAHSRQMQAIAQQTEQAMVGVTTKCTALLAQKQAEVIRADLDKFEWYMVYFEAAS